MSALPGEGTDVPVDIDIHTTAGKLEDLERGRVALEKAATRVESHGDRLYLFHEEEAVLRRCQAEHAPRGAQLRSTSLEDLFLKLTGSSLDG